MEIASVCRDKEIGIKIIIYENQLQEFHFEVEVNVVNCDVIHRPVIMSQKFCLEII